MKLHEEKISRELIYEGQIFDVTKDTVKLENGKTASREVTRHMGGVTVVALTPDNQVYVVRQFRYPYAEILTELPAGKLEKGEDPFAAALRELEEETGMKAKTLEDLGKLYPTPGYNDEIIHMYLTTEFEARGQNLDEDEFLEVDLVPLETLVQRILDGEIRDAKTQTAVLKVYARLLRQGK